MPSVRGLLALGNGKLGESIHHWGLPALQTCPGATSICQQVCYALSGRYKYPFVQERLEWNYQQSLQEDFVDRMVQEIRRKGCLVIRLHSSGDFYDVTYARKWLEVMKKCPKPKYYFYTRSYAIAAIAEVLEQMAELKGCRVWYSCDAELVPESVPKGVRLAYLQVSEEETPELMDLLFLVRRLRKRIQLPLVCPQETPQGKQEQINCGSCGKCYR
jgi:hypothetical protein